MFGLGAQEIFLLLVIGVILFGGPVVAIVVLLLLRRQGSEPTPRPDRLAELEAENRRLREEIERLKSRG
jgi:hypothetical protein